MTQEPTSNIPAPAPGNKTSVWHLLGLTLLVLLAFGSGFLTAAAVQSDKFQVQRSTVIAASPEQVFPHVNDLHQWDAWSPWAKKDPHAVNSFEGPDAGVGAKFKWSGNCEVGEGQMTVTGSTPGELVQIQLEFTKPFEDSSDVEFVFRPEGDQTRVIWTMSGVQANFIGKVMCLLMNMDQMVGTDFEAGLASLKTIVEAETSAPASDQPESAPANLP